MIRKLTVALTLVVTSSLVIASSALAMVPAGSVSGSAPSSGPSSATGSDASSLNVTLGVVLAVVAVAFLTGIAVVTRNRRAVLQP